MNQEFADENSRAARFPRSKLREPEIAKFNNQDYESIRQNCLSQGCLFEDPTFRTSNRLLVDDQSSALVSYLGRSRIDKTSIEWLRPGVSIVATKENVQSLIA